MATRLTPVDSLLQLAGLLLQKHAEVLELCTQPLREASGVHAAAVAALLEQLTHGCVALLDERRTRSRLGIHQLEEIDVVVAPSAASSAGAPAQP